MGMKRALVTGASGFTGRHACLYLAASGWEVVAVVSGRRGLEQGDRARRGAGAVPVHGGETEPSGSAAAEAGAAAGSITAAANATAAAASVGGAVRTVSCDLTDREAVRALWRDTEPDALLHLAGQNAVDRSWREPDLTLSANALSTVYLLEAMRAGGGAARALIVGSMLREPVDGPSHPYAYSKSVQVSAALAWHRWYGLPIVVAEPSNLIGPGGSTGLCGRIARWAAETEAAERSSASEPGDSAGRPAIGLPSRVAEEPTVVRQPAPFHLSSLSERRDFLDVRDCAAAYELLLRAGTPGCSYPIESGVMRSLGEVKETFDRLSPATLQWEVRHEGAVAASPAPRDCSAIRSLGWEPFIPFDDSVQDALRAERERIGLAPDGGRGGCSE